MHLRNNIGLKITFPCCSRLIQKRKELVVSFYYNRNKNLIRLCCSEVRVERIQNNLTSRELSTLPLHYQKKKKIRNTGTYKY